MALWTPLMAGNQSYDFGCVLHFHQGHRGQQLWDTIAARLIGTRELDWRAASVKRKSTNDWLGSPHPVGQWVTSQPEIINPAALHWASGIQPLRRVALEAASDLGGCRAQLHCHWRHGKSIPPSSPVLAGNKPFWGKEREGLRNRFFFGHAEEREKSGGFHVPLPAGQALYGGGSYQNGLINYKGVPFLQHVAVSMDELTHLPRGKWQIMEKHQKPDLCFFSCQHLDNVFLFLGEGRHIKLPAISEWPSVSYLPEILGDPC